MIKILKLLKEKFSKEQLCIKIFIALIIIVFQFLFQMHVSGVKREYLLYKKNLHNIEHALQHKVYNLVYMKHSLNDMAPSKELEFFESETFFKEYLLTNLKKFTIENITAEKIKDHKKVCIYHVTGSGNLRHFQDFFIFLRENGLLQRVISLSVTNVNNLNIDVAFDIEAKYK